MIAVRRGKAHLSARPSRKHRDSVEEIVTLMASPQPKSADIAQLSLYQFDACPYCAMVRNAMNRLGVDIEIRDTMRQPERRQELVAGGGKSQVPCLRIDYTDGRTEWMYESAAIIDYLRKQFG